jgi:putative FmdB family regulatory protein
MPLYDYLCPACGPFEARGSMRESNAPALCTSCAGLAPRIMSAPHLNLMPSHNRYAEMRNEKSAHEPDVVHRMKSHGHEPGHGHTHRHSPARPHAPKRPWMLGH